MAEIGGIGSRITFGGLATGLDTGALVEALIEIERRPLRLLEQQRSGLSTEQKAVQELNSLLLALREAARGIDNRTASLANPSLGEELLEFVASSSDEGVLRVDASADAQPGSTSLTVNELAASARRISIAIADPDAPIEDRNRRLDVFFGDGESLRISIPRNTTLNELRDLINGDPGNDGSFVASVLFDGSASRLVISGTETGAANNVTVSTNLRSSGTRIFPGTGQDARDASLTYLGVAVTRPSNEISDLVPGVTLRLAGVGDAEIDVSRDDEAIAEKLQAFVDAYNAVRDFSERQTTLDADNRGGPLIGDSLLRNVELQVQSVLGSVYSFGGSPLVTGGQLGISLDASGRLSLNREELQDALEADSAAVRRLLSGDDATDGLATAMARALEPIVRTGDGIVALRDDGFQERMDAIDRQIERFEDRLAAREESLIRQFAALESVISTLQSQASFLAGFQP